MIAETSPCADTTRALELTREEANGRVVDRRFNGPLVGAHSLPSTIGVASRKLPTWMCPAILATVATSFCTFGITAVQGILLARMLGPEGRGQFGTAIFYSTTLTFIGMAGAQYAIARRVAKYPGDSLQLSQSALRLAVLTGLSTFAVVAILSFTSLPLDKRFLAPLCVVAGLSLPFEHMRQFLMAIDQGSRRFWRFNVVVLLTSAVFPVLLLVVWLTDYASVTTAVCLSLAAPLVSLGFRFAVDKPLLRWTGSTLISPRTLVKEGSPYFLSSTVCDLYQRLDLFLVLWLGSFQVQGLYAAAVPAASMLQVGATALALFSFNFGSRQNLNVSRKQLLRVGVTLAGLQLVTGLMFALVIGQLIVLFYGERFAGAVPFALALIPAHAINGFTQVVEGLLRGLGNVRVGIMARVAGAVVMIITARLLFDWLRELSIPIAATVANGLVAVWLTSAAQAFAHREGPPRPISSEGNLQ